MRLVAHGLFVLGCAGHATVGGWRTVKCRTDSDEGRMGEQTAVYRVYDVDNRLLYVGISKSVLRRLTEHAATKDWWRDIARIDVEWFDARPKAAAAELKAIKNEKPRHNVVGNTRNTSQRYELHWSCDDCGCDIANGRGFVQSPKGGSIDWFAHCKNCDPFDDFAYHIEVKRLRTLQELYEFEEHLERSKGWFHYGTWNAMLVRCLKRAKH